jgi:hypothetical protein
MQPLGSQPPVVEPPIEPVRSPWYHKLGMLLFIIVCFEVGVFLLVFPWMDYWSSNSIAGMASWMRDVWDSPYFRGALSGLGLVNIYISLVEVFRLRRPPAGKLKVSVL